jgi:hypothetical protein
MKLRLGVLIGAVLLAAAGAALAAETIFGTIGGRAQQQMPFAVFPAVNGGQFYTMQEPKQLLTDSFGVSSLNTINKWSTSTASGGVAAANGTCPGATCGQTTLGTGTTSNGISILSSQLLFNERNPGYNRFQTNINLPPPGTLNQYLFWGYSSATSSTVGLTAAAPCGSANLGAVAVAFGFNLQGKLEAFTCASGVKTQIADLSVAQGPNPVQTSSGMWLGGCACLPQEPDTQSYKYLIDFRGDNINWYTEAVDGTLNRVAFATRGAVGPDVNQMSVAFGALAGSTPPTVSSNIQVNQVTIGDTAGNPVVAVHVVASTTAGVVLKASPGALISLVATNSSAASASFMIGNSATVFTGTPTYGTASGNVQECFTLAAGATQVLSYAPQPYEQFNTGISVVPSTGICTATIAAPATAVIINAAVQ